MPFEARRNRGREAPGEVHIVVALAPEARPIIDHLRLRSVGDGVPFPVYEDAEGATRLICTGVGKVAAAAACGVLMSRAADPRHVAWLQVGVAAHPSAEKGTPFLAHKITEAATGRSGYPQRTFAAPCHTAPFETVDTPQRTLTAPDVVTEMEAWGFFSTCVRTSPAELVHAVKIISDHGVEPGERWSKQDVTRLIAARIGVIDDLLRELRALSGELSELHRDPAELPEFLGRWRFSRTQKRELEELLRRWRLARPHAPSLAGREGLPDSRSVLRDLRRAVAELPLGAFE